MKAFIWLFSPPSCLSDKCALEGNWCDWSRPVIDEPISRLSDPADCFIIDVIFLYIRAESTESTVRLEEVPPRSLTLRSLELSSQTQLELLEKLNSMTSCLLHLVSFIVLQPD